MTNDQQKPLSPSLIEAKLEKLRAEWRKSTRSQREVLKQQARCLENALALLKKRQDAIAHPFKVYPKPAFTDSG